MLLIFYVIVGGVQFFVLLDVMLLGCKTLEETENGVMNAYVKETKQCIQVNQNQYKKREIKPLQTFSP